MVLGLGLRRSSGPQQLPPKTGNRNKTKTAKRIVTTLGFRV